MVDNDSHIVANSFNAKPEDQHDYSQHDEVIADNGLTVILTNRTLYHGSGTADISSFQPANEATVGNGVYLTSQAKDATGYANRRSKISDHQKRVLYECRVEKARVVDLRKDENVKAILVGFKDYLTAWCDAKRTEGTLKWFTEMNYQRVMEVINSGEVHSGNLRLVSSNFNQVFTDYLTSLGYEGLITYEGGEGDDVGSHDTYLIFDPQKVQISSQQIIE